MKRAGRSLPQAESGSRCIPASPGRKCPKIVFHAEDVPPTREILAARGARFGKVRQWEFCLCDGKDPDGNPLQLSNR